MRKVKYYYNTTNLRYEKIEIPVTTRLLQLGAFLCASLVFAVLITLLLFKFIDSPKEKRLEREMAELSIHYDELNGRLALHSDVLTDLQERDNNIYRVIFEAEPIPESVREAGFGGSNRYKNLESSTNRDLLMGSSMKIDQLEKQLYVQSKSYDQLSSLIKNKEELYAAIPSIQPISNTDLKRIASGYGYRNDPITKVRKFHEGMDFTAPVGTEIYSTGKGEVVKIRKLRTGYGYHLVIDHGFNYKTLYAHLSEIKVKKGQIVTRGEVIGAVGNTGKSTAPHLHYEVWKNGKKVDPKYYYFKDITADEYDQIIEMGSKLNQSFD